MGDVRRSTPRRPIKDRILARVVIDDSGCWLWQGTRIPNGYGTIGVRHARKGYVHRVAYETWIGAIPEGHIIDHLCRVRICCNPAHLEAVTPSQNTVRGDTIPVRRAARTHCLRNHEYTLHNTVWQAGRNGKRKRGCRTCIALRRSGAVAPLTARLSEADVRRIRTRAAAGESASRIARDYPVWPSAIESVIRRRSWANVA